MKKIFIFLVFLSIFFTGLLFFLDSVPSVYAQACIETSRSLVNCGDNSTMPVDPSPYGHFSNSAVGTTGTLSVACDQRVINTSQQEVINYSNCPPSFSGVCEPNVSNTGNEVACAVYASCGNSIKEEYECCDGGPNCNGACQCVFSQGEQPGFCGDGICSGGESAVSCGIDCGSGACSSFMNVPGIDPGNVNILVYQGETASLGIETNGPSSGDNFNVSFIGACPSGATCSPSSGINNGRSEIIVGYDGGGAPIYDYGPYQIGFNVTTGASTPVGNYPVVVQIHNTSEPACSSSARKNLIVKPSRKTVCDGSWYEIPPGANFTNMGTNPRGGAGIFNSPNLPDIRSINFFHTSGESLFEQICTYPGSTNTSCTWGTDYNENKPNPGQQITHAPYLTSAAGVGPPPFFYSVINVTRRLRYNSISTTYRSNSVNGSWFSDGNTFAPPSAVWGTPVSTTDNNGRTYNFRRNGDHYEYSCSVTQPDLIVNNLQVIGGLTVGTNLGFSGLVSNTGTGSTGVDFDSRLRIDIGNNDTWDVTVSPNHSSGPLAASASETETWSNAWVATAGTHKFEICTDINNEVTESNESNCFTSTFIVSAGAMPNLVIQSSSLTPAIRTAGSNLTFLGIVRNSGTAPTGVAPAGTSQTRLTIDINSNGFGVGIPADVVIDRATSILSPAPTNPYSENEWYNWTAVAGTHVYRITADVGSTIAESNEGDNIYEASFTVAPPNAVPSISASPGTISNGGSSNITWSCSTGTGNISCSSGSCPWSGSSGVNSTGALSANVTYTLTCQNGGTTANTTVTVITDYTLNVIKSGQGTVTSNPAGISCGADCSQAYAPDTAVTLTATPATGRIFTGWSGDCTGRGTCNLIMNSSKSVNANFAIDPNYKEF